MEKITCPNTIAILMATYNGEKYLCEQIDSLLAQTCQHWHLYIHDDGSKDNTLAIIREYITKQPDRITCLEYPSQGGACLNFLSLLDKVDADYYMFCDQDDVWKSDKVEKEYQRIQDLERRHPELPVIVNTDLEVVDEKLLTLHPSFWEYEGIVPEWLTSFEHYAAVNAVTGCTMMLNDLAKRVVKKPYDRAMMHDAWITLSVVAAEGIVDYLREPLILYRQHGSNTLGARSVRMLTWKYRLENILTIFRLNKQHYQQMSSIHPLSLSAYLSMKIKYRLFLKKRGRT